MADKKDDGKSEKKFAGVATPDDDTADEEGVKYREKPLYTHGMNRPQFERDGQRILHSNAFRRLKNKTQVFFNIDSDHVCTRMEHVLHVQSVSNTIASNLGLNTNLTSAIAMGHDLGHAPFGHEGEKVLSDISEKHLGIPFWHERNGLRFVEKIELLQDNEKKYEELNLTYHVRDGIISHCGEVDNQAIVKREEMIDLEKQFQKAGEYEPYTWEGCVVKMSDKIAYVGRDIEDAFSLGILEQDQINELNRIRENLNTTTIMGDLITDICETSTVEKGIGLSDEKAKMLKDIKEFNYKHIYDSPKMDPYKRYCRTVLEELFSTLKRCYKGEDTVRELRKSPFVYLANTFADYLCKYCDTKILSPEDSKKADDYKNEKIYKDLSDECEYIQAIIDFLSGMTDRYAIEAFNSLLRFSSKDLIILSNKN